MSQLMLIQGVMCCCVRFLNRYRPLRQLIGERPAVVVKNRKN